MSIISKAKRSTKKSQTGIAALTQAAGTALELHKNAITECLVCNIKKGHAPSAKLLVELAQTPAKDVATRRRRRSRALALAVESNWSDEKSDIGAVASGRK